MAIKKEIEINVKSNAGNASKDVANLSTSLKTAGNSAQEMGSKLQKSGKASSTIGGISDAVGKLNPALGGAIKGADGLIVKMWQIVANPVGAIIAAIVLAVTALYKAFTSTKAGGEQMDQMMAGLGAVMDVLRDRILKIGSAIAKFFSGDFKGALKDARSSVSGLGDEIEKEFKQAAQAKKYLQEVEDALRTLSVSRAKLNRDLAKSKEIISDENASYAEKKKAINEVRIAEEKQTNAELKNAEKKLKAIKLANSLSDTSKEDLQKQADAEAALYALQEKSATDRRAIKKTEERADKEEQARLKTIADEAKERNKAAAEDEKAAIDEKLKTSKLSFDEQRKLVNDDNKLAEKDKKDFLKRINEEERKAIEDHKKAIVDLEGRYKTDLENLNAKTDQQKLDLQKKRELEEINRITSNEEERANLLIQFNEKYQILQSELDTKNKDKEAKAKLDKTAKDIENSNLDFQTRYAALAEQERLIKELTGISEEERNKMLENNAKKRQDIAKAEAEFKEKTYRDNYNNLQNILSVGGKGMQKVAKALAIADVVRTAAQSVAGTIASTGKANSLAVAASPLTGGMPFVAINTVKAALSIGSTIASATKAIGSINSEGKSAPSASTPASGGGGGGAAPAPPQFNVVGGSTANQLATTLGSQQPIQAFVVANQVTSQQSMDRNIVNNASIG